MNAHSQEPGPPAGRPLSTAEASAEAARLIHEAYRQDTPPPHRRATATPPPPRHRNRGPGHTARLPDRPAVGRRSRRRLHRRRRWNHRPRMRSLARPPGPRLGHAHGRARGDTSLRRARRRHHRRRNRHRPGPRRLHHPHLQGHRHQADRGHLHRTRTALPLTRRPLKHPKEEHPVRLRITRTTWPRPALVLTDTPRPRCPDCQGRGVTPSTTATTTASTPEPTGGPAPAGTTPAAGPCSPCPAVRGGGTRGATAGTATNRPSEPRQRAAGCPDAPRPMPGRGGEPDSPARYEEGTHA